MMIFSKSLNDVIAHSAILFWNFCLFNKIGLEFLPKYSANWFTDTERFLSKIIQFPVKLINFYVKIYFWSSHSF